MMFVTWTKNEIELLIDMLKDGHTVTEVSDEITLRAINSEPGFPAKRSARSVESKRDKLAGQPSVTLDNYESVDNRWLTIQQIQRAYSDASKFLDIGLVDTPTRKILSLSDIHFPFARLDFLNKAVEDHADADIAVLNGDILDGHAASTFEKDRAVAAVDEYRCAFDFVHLLAKKFKRVVLVGGNHDVRPEKALKRSNLSPATHDIFAPDLLARIANGERLDRTGQVVEKVDMSNVFYPSTEPWWIQIGKTLFIHPHSRGSSKPAYTVSSWAKKFQERLPPGAFDSIVSGHTHQTSKHIQSNLLQIEQGCLCNYMSYSWNPTQLYHSSAMNGYAVIYQDQEGNTDFNKSGFVYLGQLLPVDKPVWGGNNGHQNSHVLLT